MINAKGMYGDMAKGIVATGNDTLKCMSCGRVKECGESDLITFLRSGWPKCCGSTMRLMKSEEATP